MDIVEDGENSWMEHIIKEEMLKRVGKVPGRKIFDIYYKRLDRKNGLVMF